MDESQELFLRKLSALAESARKKKNTLEYDEITKVFEGVDLSEEDMDHIYEYMEKKNIAMVPYIKGSLVMI